MISPKFIQVHFLAAWPGALLNRDDAGLAKRLPFGSATRTRVSSQCLKRHWRMADDPRALHRLAGDQDAIRSKITIERLVTNPLKGRFPDDAVKAVETALYEKVYGKNAAKSDQRQALLLGRSEIAYLRETAERVLSSATDAKAAASAMEAWAKDEKSNLSQLRDQNALAPGLESALFGRMVTSDSRANTDAAIHVAHAFTVHEEQPELDYFTVVDDLRSREEGDDAGAAGVFDTELTSGLYYGYVVVDVPLLVSNLTGCDRKDWAGEHDRALAAKVVENLVWLIAEISPGAKKGSTAPYSRAELVLIEAGDRQPRTLANAFREPVPLDHGPNESLGRRTSQAMAGYLEGIDAMYATGEVRGHAALSDLRLDGVEHLTLPALAAWAGGLVRDAAC